MKTFLKLSVILVMLAIGMVVVTVIESRQQYGAVPKTPPTSQQVNNMDLQNTLHK